MPDVRDQRQLKAPGDGGEHDDAVLAGAIAEATKDCASERKLQTRPRWTEAQLRRNPALGPADGFRRSRFIDG